jgi:Ala-tRNA(Pro) deacylase
MSLKKLLNSEGVDYEVVSHAPTASSAFTAAAAHVPGDQLAKSVLLEDEKGYLMAVVPASCRLELGALHRMLDRPLGLATEAEVSELFWDCAAGAIPALAGAYGIEAVYDDRLLAQSEVYIEAGDHEALVHLSGEQFRHLTAAAMHAPISNHV